MRLGQLNRSIVLQSNTPSRDATGASVPSWGTLATVWAQVLPVAGGETFGADQITALADVKLRIRHRTDVTTKVRVSYASKVYDITRIDELGRGAGLDLYCKVRTPS